MTRRLLPIAAIVAGGALTAVVAYAVNMPTDESLRLALLAGGAALLAGVAGGVALAAARTLPFGAQVTIVALTSVVAVGVGAAIAAREMFLSAHDLRALWVVLVASGTVGCLVAMVLGRRVSEASKELGETARRIGEGEIVTESAVSGGELAELARELEEVSRRLDEARRKERALDGSRRELVAWVSHDLRTPLAGVRAMAEALEDGVIEDAETVDRYHRALRVETDRLAGLVDDLFELSRINAGALRLHLEKVSLGDLVSDALAGAAVTARTKGVKLEGRLTTDAPQVQLSTPEIARALRNLLENAIRHTPNDGSVWVEAGIEADYAYLSVADECGGIQLGDLDRVFDVAWRKEAARTPDGDGGAGLGLAIARGIVEAHNGHISVENEANGCCFTMRLPLSQPGEAS
jgi:signal transduction histidine kinase